MASRPQELEVFAASLAPGDEVALEATGNALAIARIIERHEAAPVRTAQAWRRRAAD